MRQITLPPVAQRLADGAALGGWWHDDLQEDGRIICDLCPRACALREGDKGFCFVRENRQGEMVLGTYGYSTGFCIDPIEKKPLNQFYPNTSVLSFGTAGCNLGCKFCQNWSISKSREVESLSESASPAAVAQAALRLECKSVAFTYNDPVVWAEYAIDCAKACHAVGVKTVAVTAGYITPAARAAFYEHIDAANVDLKGFTEEFYQKLTLSHLQPVLDTLEWLVKETNVWLEITNLMIPQANDSSDELKSMCDWLLQHLGPHVPIHFTAFHPDFRLQDRPRTSPETLFRAYDIATKSGLKYVYVGNIADVPRQTTYCPNCRQPLIVRAGYDLHTYAIRNNCCAYCGTKIAGHYDTQPGTWGPRRQPVRIADFERSTGTQHAPRLELGQPITIQHRPAEPTVVNLNISTRNALSNQTFSLTSPKVPNMTQTAPELNDQVRQSILATAGEIIAATATNRQPNIIDTTLSGFADLPVFGCFVTAKREGHLRSCCGYMTPNIPLGVALANAARRTANDDPRFPAISPAELPFLHLDAWLLFNPQPVQEQGANRIKAVTIGKHGLQIARGNQRGLLLPGVALEMNLNAERFLQHVCLKAGLPPHAWQDADVELATFEGIAIEGDMPEASLQNIVPAPVKFQANDAQSLAQWFAQNVLAHLTGGSPFPYAFNVADGEARGILVALSGNGSHWMHVTKLALREGLPVQSTLFTMSQQAAQALANMGITMEILQTMQVNLAIFEDVTLHGSVATPDMRGLDLPDRALLVIERNNVGLVYDKSLSPTEALARAAALAELLTPEHAGVYTARIATTADSFTLRQGPTPEAGPVERQPAVAGTFYPANANELQKVVTDMLGDIPKSKQQVTAVLVPHAGLKYSGRLAADVLKRVAIPETVIIIGPKHTALGVDWAIEPAESWSIPGTKFNANKELAQELINAIPGLHYDAAAHIREHAIEVELPFLAQLAPETKIVGICIGAASYSKCQEFASGLAKVLRDKQGEVLVIVSSDMNHYASDSENRRLDALALECVEAGNAKQLLTTCREENISMCGVLPTVMVMEALQELGRLGKVEKVGYATSADVTGDKTRVVGYAGLIWAS
jgi:AmmeMemoRadiSam system radical SAM enzyme/AmmeMemoRadiSam system protein B/AmmeMemoRadiSam system protein A